MESARLAAPADKTEVTSQGQGPQFKEAHPSAAFRWFPRESYIQREVTLRHSLFHKPSQHPAEIADGICSHLGSFHHMHMMCTPISHLTESQNSLSWKEPLKIM